jgi:hypothetical protein
MKKLNYAINCTKYPDVDVQAARKVARIWYCASIESVFVESLTNGCISLTRTEKKTARKQPVAARSVPSPSSGRIAMNRILRYLEARSFIKDREELCICAAHKYSQISRTS